MMKYYYLFSTILLFANCQSKSTEVPIANMDKDPFQELSKRIELDSNNLELILMRAQLAYEQEQYDQAIMDYKKAKNIAPYIVQFRHFLADAYLDYYRSREALGEMEEAFADFPDSINTGLKLSEFQYLLKQHDASLETVGKILIKNPTNAEAYFMMGQNFKEKLDTARAINSFQSAVEFDSDLIDGWIELGNLFLGMGNPIASQYFDNAVRVDTNDVYSRFARAFYYQIIGDTLNAIRDYEGIIGIQYDYTDAFLNAGILYLNIDSLDKAYSKFDQLELLDKTDPRPYYFKALIYIEKGINSQAKGLLEQAIRLNPDFEEAKQALKLL